MAWENALILETYVILKTNHNNHWCRNSLKSSPLNFTQLNHKSWTTNKLEVGSCCQTNHDDANKGTEK